MKPKEKLKRETQTYRTSQFKTEFQMGLSATQADNP